MSRADCLRALGLDPDASWDTIRQAYKDLVRVWHPDRFLSDPELQQRAERRLLRINEAYLALKRLGVSTAATPPAQPSPKPAEPGAPPTIHPDHACFHRGTRSQFHFRMPLKAVWLGLLCLSPLMVGSLIVNAIQIPTLESLSVPSAPSTPVVLAPYTWARGAAMDLFDAIPKVGQKSTGQPPLPFTRPSPPVTPENGAELLHTRMHGGSELLVSNPTNHDAIARLVQSDTTAPLRMVYIQAKSGAVIRHIAPGQYDLLAETGEGWDADQVRFQTSRRALPRWGPFQCIDVTSSQGTYGPKFKIILGAK